MRKKLNLPGVHAAHNLADAKSKNQLNRALWKKRTFLPAITSTMANALIASIGEGLIIVDEYGQISHLNQPALDILGYEREELEGAWLPGAIQVFDDDGRQISPEQRPVLQALLTGASVSETISCRRKDGSLVPLFSTSSPFLVKGQPRGAIIVFRDITKEKQIEQAKDEFVSLASHQLRSPLTSVRMFAELLSDPTYGQLTKQQRDYLDKILFSTDKMISLVTELLNISRINLGQLQFQPVPTDLNRLISTRLEEIRPLAEQAGAKLAFSSRVKPTDLALIDRNLIAQAVHNLLSNAVRYSPPGRGRVDVHLSKSAKYYKITVSDNGIGIPLAARSRLFQRFYRADNAIKAQSEGTGLGLYLVKTVVEASGGKITYHSQEGHGASFSICLPVKPPNA